MKDIIIIGAGPAGITAAIYAARAGLDAAVIEKEFIGGQAAKTAHIENYPGFESISGIDLSMAMMNQAEKLNVEIIYDETLEISTKGEIKRIKTSSGEYEAKTLILCMGAIPRKLEIKGEEEFSGRGVSYCATCDGAFFKGKTVCIIGGGDTAGEDALYLSSICEKVYLIHRRDELRMQAHLQKKIREAKNVETILSAIPLEFSGKDVLEAIRIKNLKSGEEKEIAVSGAFVAVGVQPQSELIKGQIETQSGYIIANDKRETSEKGVFAAGDIVKKPLRQIVTAVSDGAVCVYSAMEYLAGK